MFPFFEQFAGYSLQSRDLIADSVETVAAAQFYDGVRTRRVSEIRRPRYKGGDSKAPSRALLETQVVCVPGCDKNMPGAARASNVLDLGNCVEF